MLFETTKFVLIFYTNHGKPIFNATEGLWLLFLVYDAAAAAAKSRQSCMSDSVRSHRWQPTRLPHPWDSPGKNTGVGFHFLLQCMKVKSESEVAQPCLILRDPMDYSPPGSSVHGIFQARVLEWGAIAFSGSMVSARQKDMGASQVVLMVKNAPANSGDLRDSGSIPG